METTLAEVVANKDAYRRCTKCGAINWHENVICVKCGREWFAELTEENLEMMTKNYDVNKVFYVGELRTKEISDENKKKLKSYIEEIEKETIKLCGNERKSLERRLEIVKRYSETPPATEKEQKELESLLCYGDEEGPLGYCCGLSKDCGFRNIVLLSYGISHDVYREIKNECGKHLKSPDIINI